MVEEVVVMMEEEEELVPEGHPLKEEVEVGYERLGVCLQRGNAFLMASRERIFPEPEVVGH